MQKLATYLKSMGFVTASIVNGPNGDFISAKKGDDSKETFPIGKKSQGCTSLMDMNVIVTASGQAIGTVNQYEDVDTVTL
tara:strand:- start:190 stop:429 length:240 start_codon:yes stop_codon:yes gene_type:complete